MATVNSIKHIPPLDAETLRRFWARVSRVGPGDCWTWIGATAHGYGRFYFHRHEFYLANRVSWMIAHGEQPKGFVCHSCDNPICVNPAHLWLGDATANNRDRELKGRGGNASKLLCKHGHSLHDALRFRNMRRCRECSRIRSSQYRKKEAA